MIDMQALLIEKLTDVVNKQLQDIKNLQKALDEKYDRQFEELRWMRRAVPEMEEKYENLRIERDALAIALKAAVAEPPPEPPVTPPEPPVTPPEPPVTPPEPPAAPPEPTRDPTRDPPPPDALVGALQDRVHYDTGRIRPAKSVKVPSTEDDA
jgi:hypothetical protein